MGPEGLIGTVSEVPRYNVPHYNVPRYNVPRYNVPRYNVPRYNVPATMYPYPYPSSAWADTDYTDKGQRASSQHPGLVMQFHAGSCRFSCYHFQKSLKKNVSPVPSIHLALQCIQIY